MSDAETIPPLSASGTRRHRGHRVRWLFGRALSGLVALWLLVSVAFVGLHLSGNPVLRMLGDEATLADQRALEQTLGYADPLHVQYFRFLGAVARGGFPNSLQYGVPAMEVVSARLPASALLAFVGLGLGLGIGLGAGYLGAFRANRPSGRVALALLSLLQAVPPFLIGILLVLFFAVKLRLLPTSGSGGWRHVVLPALTIAFLVAPTIGRVFRTSLVEVSGQFHVTAARARALSESRIRRRHIVCNALIPVVTVAGLQLGSLLGGTMIVEQVFGWPGIGQLALNAVSYQDFPLILACTAVMGLAFLVTSFLADLLARAIDPRGASA